MGLKTTVYAYNLSIRKMMNSRLPWATEQKPIFKTKPNQASEQIPKSINAPNQYYRQKICILIKWNISNNRNNFLKDSIWKTAVMDSIKFTYHLFRMKNLFLCLFFSSTKKISYHTSHRNDNSSRKLKAKVYFSIKIPFIYHRRFPYEWIEARIKCL